MKSLFLVALGAVLVILSGCVAYPVGGNWDLRNQGAEHSRDGDRRDRDQNRDDNRKADGQYDDGRRGPN